MASRHLCRMIALQSLYEWDFWNKEKDIDEILEKNIRTYGEDLEEKEFIRQLVKNTIAHLDDIDKIIEKSAPERPLNQINIVDKNILRLGLYEMIYANSSDVPLKVAINEAVELAKNFGSDKSFSFINGVLGTVARSIDSIKNTKSL